MFDVECDIDSGFMVTADENCRARNYPHFDFSDGEFFIFAENDTVEDLSQPDVECYLNSTGHLTVDFENCGNIQNEDTFNSTKFISYVHHRINISNVVGSLMDQIRVECHIP